MALDRSIGSTGLEQGGPNLGNDYSRDISGEHRAEESLKVIVPRNEGNSDSGSEEEVDDLEDDEDLDEDEDFDEEDDEDFDEDEEEEDDVK